VPNNFPYHIISLLFTSAAGQGINEPSSAAIPFPQGHTLPGMAGGRDPADINHCRALVPSGTSLAQEPAGKNSWGETLYINRELLEILKQ